MTYAIETAALRRTFGENRALDGVDLRIRQGAVYGLLGPNGAGKTTTISMICGLLDRDDGEVTVGGRPLTTRAVSAKAAIGYVPQEVALYPDLSARENLRFFGQLYGMSGTRLAERVEHLLGDVGLAERADERVEQYSGGMRRRANIAAGLLHDPALLVLDEPTVGVDPQTRHAIFSMVAALRDAGKAVLYTTHYMEEAERLCDRVGIIDEGRIVAEGTRRQLVERVGQRDRVQVSATGDLDRLAAGCQGIEGVESVAVVEDGLELVVHEGRRRLSEVFETADRAGVAVAAVEVVEPDLEAVFLHLTGRALRD